MRKQNQKQYSIYISPFPVQIIKHETNWKKKTEQNVFPNDKTNVVQWDLKFSTVIRHDI